MRIAIDLCSLADNFSGIERYTLNLTQELLKQDDNNEYELIFKGKIYPDFEIYQDSSNIHFHILKQCRKLFFYQFRLPHYLRKMKCDFYCFFAFPAPILFNGRGNIVGVIHDLSFIDVPQTMKWYVALYYRLSNYLMFQKAKKILTVSDFSRQRIAEFYKYDAKKILLTSEGISNRFLKKVDRNREQNKFFRQKYHLPKEYYLFLATLEPRKNIGLLLDAYKELCDEKKLSAKLVLVGRMGWKNHPLMTKLNSFKNGEIIYLGFVEDEDLPYLYQLAKGFVYTSLYEGFGLTPLEAISLGVPVITSDIPAVKEVLGDSAFYFKSNDKEDLKRVWNDYENQYSELEKKQVIEKGMMRSKQFRNDNVAKTVLDYFKES